MMKKTRCAFCLVGENKDILNYAVILLSGFKATKLIAGDVSRSTVDQVFACNKSVICTDPKIQNFAETVVFVGVNNPDQKYNINVIDFTSIENPAEEQVVSKMNFTSILNQFQRIAEDCNIDIGDHRSNSTKEGPSQKPQDCVFCRYLSGHPDHYQPSMYESENFVVMGNTGHFVLGSLLIIPKKHIMSCAELNPEELAELSEVIQDCKYILREIFGMDTLLWENGSGSGGHGKDKSSIVHAHIHMNPCDMDCLKVSAEKGITPKHIAYSELTNYQENSYLLIQDYDNEWYIVSNPDLYIPRQYVRQLVAEHVNLPGDLWNWRKYMFLDNVRVTTYMVRDYLVSHKDTLPNRILERTRHFS